MTWPPTSSPRGGPMVAVNGFPGPLYPPDHPKGPSPDTPLALALKRWAARLGAWPWDPDGWDDSYSNRFAHGDGWGDETHAGIEGVQHWSGTLEPTGNVGEQTFNFARSVKVPQGRTHAGEMALDSVCVQLINQAYDDAHPAAPSTTVREAALARAVGEIGQTENPAGSNLTEYGDWYGENGVPWCAIFATWCYELGAKDIGWDGSPSFLSLAASGGAEDRYDYVPWIVSDARNGRNGLSVTSNPTPGDLVCFDWQRDGEYDHVGLFESGTPSSFTALEGNTSTSDNSNGGEVMRRGRDPGQAAIVFIRVAEP